MLASESAQYNFGTISFVFEGFYISIEATSVGFEAD